MELRMILRDKKRTFAIMISLFLIVTAVTGSVISSHGSMVSIISKAIEITQPNVEITITPQLLMTNGSYTNITYGEIIDYYKTVGRVFTNTKMDPDKILNHGSVIYTPVAIHYKIKLGDCGEHSTTNYAVEANGGIVYYLTGFTQFLGGEEACILRLSLGVISPIEKGDIPSINMLSGRYPESGHTPIEVTVYSGFAEYMGWSMGKVVDFLGNRIVIVGMYNYTGGFDSFSEYTRSYPIIIVNVDDLDRFLANESLYTIRLLSGYNKEQIGMYMMITKMMGESYPSFYSKGMNESKNPIFTSLPKEGILPSYDIVYLYNPKELTEVLGINNYTFSIPAKQRVSSMLILYATISPGLVVQLIQSNNNTIMLNNIIKQEIVSSFQEQLPSNLTAPLVILFPNSMYSYDSNSPVVYTGSLSQDISYLVSMISFNRSNDIVNFSILIITLSILVIGYLTSNHVVQISLADLRVYLSLLVARGSPSSRLKLRLLLMIAILAVFGLVAGNLFSIYSIGYFFYTATGFNDLHPSNLVMSKWLWITPAIMILMTVLLIYRSSIREVSNIKPIEAVRPVEAVKKSFKKRRISPSMILYVFAIASLIIVASGGPDELFNKVRDHGIAAIAIVFLVAVIGMIGLPFSPLALSYILTKHFEASNRLFMATSRIASSLAGSLRETSLRSSLRLGDRIKGVASTSIMAFSVAVGSIFAASGLSKLSYSFRESYALGSSVALESMSGLYSASYSYTLLAVYAFVIGALALYTMYSSTFKLVEGEVLIMRARGASRGDALRFVYGMFMSNSLVILVSSIVAGLGFWFMSVGSLWLASGAKWALDLDLIKALVYSFSSLRPWIFLGFTVFYIIILPLIVSYTVVRVRDVARLLRGRGLG